MSSITYEFKASYAFIERNFNIVKRYWAWELVWPVSYTHLTLPTTILV